MRPKYNLFFGFWISASILMFTGCAETLSSMLGNKPKEFAQKLPKTEGFSYEAKKQLAAAIVARYWNDIDKSGCMVIKYRSSTGAIHNYRNCFEVRSNDTIKRVDQSTMTEGKRTYKTFLMYNGVNSYNKAIESIQTHFERDFKAYMEIYHTKYKNELTQSNPDAKDISLLFAQKVFKTNYHPNLAQTQRTQNDH